MQKIFLVVATVGRTTPLADFLQSLLVERNANRIHVIIVDQNIDSRLSSVVQIFWDELNIQWIGSPRGLSRARNAGLRIVEGQGDEEALVGFPDDDCCYPPGFLEALSHTFTMKDVDFLSVREMSSSGETDTRPPSDSGPITLYNVWRGCGSNRTFYTTKAIRKIGKFDVNLGLGAGTAWEGGEDIDYPVRGLKVGLLGWFTNSLHVVHQSTIASGTVDSRRRTIAYNAAMGRIWKVHGYPAWWLGYQCCRAIGGMALSLCKADLGSTRRHWLALRGRVGGWFSSQRL